MFNVLSTSATRVTGRLVAERVKCEQVPTQEHNPSQRKTVM